MLHCPHVMAKFLKHYNNCNMKEENIQRALHQYIQEHKICGASYAFLSDTSSRNYYDGVAGCIAPYHHQILEAGDRYDLASLTKVV